MATVTQSGKREGSVETSTPAVLDMTTLKELKAALSESLAVKKIKSQLTVDFRGKIRSLMEAKNEDGTWKHSLEDIAAMDFTEWIPTERTVKTKADKIKDILNAGDMSPEEIAELKALLEG